MSECQKREIMLVKYAEGLLEGMERGEVEMHLAECSVCQQWLEEYRRLKETVESEGFSDRGDEYWEGFQRSVLERIRERGLRGGVAAGERKGVGQGERRFFKRYGAVAAGALAVFVLVIGVARIALLPPRIGPGESAIIMTDAAIEISLIMGMEGATGSYQEQERLFKEFLNGRMEETLLGRMEAIGEQTDFFSTLRELSTTGIKAEEEFYRELFNMPDIQNGRQNGQERG